MSKRILYWDVIKCFAIFMVVWGHSIEMLQPDISKIWNDPIASTIISFHMPLFMTVSGYFARSVFTTNLWDMVVKKARQLLLPSVSLYFIIGIALIFLRHQEFCPAFQSLLGYCSVSFWFLKALFIYYVLTCAVVILWRKSSLLSISVVIFGGAILPVAWLDYVHCMSMFPYFLIGIILFKFEHVFFSHKIEILIGSCITYLILTYYYPTQEYDMYTHLFAWDIEILRVYVLRTTIGVSASLALIIIIREMCLRLGDNRTVKFFAYIGTFTLGIYVIHTEINQFCHQYMLPYISALNPYKGSPHEMLFFDYVICLPASVCIIACCIFAMKIIRLNKYTKLILLGEK